MLSESVDLRIALPSGNLFPVSTDEPQALETLADRVWYALHCMPRNAAGKPPSWRSFESAHPDRPDSAARRRPVRTVQAGEPRRLARGQPGQARAEAAQSRPSTPERSASHVLRGGRRGVLARPSQRDQACGPRARAGSRPGERRLSNRLVSSDAQDYGRGHAGQGRTGRGQTKAGRQADAPGLLALRGRTPQSCPSATGPPRAGCTAG
jgi:hypothetical protein